MAIDSDRQSAARDFIETRAHDRETKQFCTRSGRPVAVRVFDCFYEFPSDPRYDADPHLQKRHGLSGAVELLSEIQDNLDGTYTYVEPVKFGAVSADVNPEHGFWGGDWEFKFKIEYDEPDHVPGFPAPGLRIDLHGAAVGTFDKSIYYLNYVDGAGTLKFKFAEAFIEYDFVSGDIITIRTRWELTCYFQIWLYFLELGFRVTLISGKRIAKFHAFLLANPATGFAPLLVTFTDASFPPNGTTNRKFIYGDGADSGLTTSNPVTHNYPTPGIYQSQLQVTDETGVTEISDLLPITVNAPANFSWTNSSTLGPTPTKVFFTDTTSAAGPAGAPVAWLWTFGDPTSPDPTSTLQNPSHLFYVQPCAVVSLKVTFANGLQNTVTKHVNTLAGASCP